MDSAGVITRFTRITLPLLTPIIFFNLIMQMVSAFQAFTPAFLISGGNGGPADFVLFYTLYLYQQGFGNFRMGYASAMAWGGNEAAVKECLPILHVVGDKDHLTYCGQAGNGQVVKGVNQLMMGLVSAAYLEAISFGVNEGASIEIIHDAVSSESERSVPSTYK